MSSAQTMKIYSIISRIEQVLNDSPKYKLGGGNKKIVEVEELFDLLGDLKVTIPEDIRRASGIITEEANILSDANDQAEETINKANGYVNLSEYGSSGWGIWQSPSKSVNITHHGGTLSWSKAGSKPNALSVNIIGNTLNLSKTNSSDAVNATVTVTSAATANYNAASATYTCTP